MKKLILIVIVLIIGYVFVANKGAENQLERETTQQQQLYKQEQQQKEQMENLDKELQQNLDSRMQEVNE